MPGYGTTETGSWYVGPKFLMSFIHSEPCPCYLFVRLCLCPQCGHFVSMQVYVQQPTCMTVMFPFLVPRKDFAWMCTFMYCHVYIFKYIYIWGLVRRSIEKIKYVNICLRQSAWHTSWVCRYLGNQGCLVYVQSVVGVFLILVLCYSSSLTPIPAVCPHWLHTI